MTDQPAENTPSVPPPAQPQPMPTQQQIDDRLDQVLFPIVNTVAMGIRVSVVGINVDMLLAAICRNLGRVMGMQFGISDNLALTLKARKACKDEFAKGMDSIKPQMSPQQGAAMTAIPRNGHGG
jgi:hypothetical protein